MRPRPNLKIFFGGFVAGIIALAFNLILWIGGLAAFLPQAALSEFLSIVPASLEEPMVQSLGGYAGELGLVMAFLVGAVVYGLLAIVFDRFLAERLRSVSLSIFESILVFALVPWLLFGLVLFPLLGDSFFGIASPAVASSNVWVLTFSLLLVQGVFALLFSPRYIKAAVALQEEGPRAQPSAPRSRREFIEKGALVVLAAVAGVVGLTSLAGLASSSQFQPSGGGSAIDLQGAPAIFGDSRLQSLVDSEVTPNNGFYVVDIDIVDPSVNTSTWTLKVDGLVNTPKNYTLQALQGLPNTSQYTTLECVSNDINGSLISNAKWTGVKFSDLFQDVGGLQQAAGYVVFYSLDDYSVAIPLAKAMSPESMLAFTMNGQPLPVGHGYPARALVPGLYGMMSAKWLKEVMVVGQSYEGYWQTRGWSSTGVINTVAFIVVPQAGSPVSLSQNNGSVIVAGYAFAGDRGISKVEVSFDGGKTWQQAQLKPQLSKLTWALWAIAWQPPSTGSYPIYARATDGNGQVQTKVATPTFPNGATGYAYVELNVAK